MENVQEQFFNSIFQIDATIKCKFNVHQSCRAPRTLSYRLRAFLNPLREFREKLKIKTITIQIVLECMENVWVNIFN